MQEEIAKYNNTDYVIDKPSQHPIDKPGYVNFYNPYRHWQGKSRFARDVAFFTHPGEIDQWNAAMQCDAAIVMCDQYRQALIDAGMYWKRIHRVHLGIDERYRDCRLRIFHPGRMVISGEYQARKGWDDWKRLMELDWLDCIRSEGMLTDEQMRDEYMKADVIVSTATMEGGPMGCIEALAMGKTYIGRAGVGVHDEYAKHIARYHNHDELVVKLWQAYKEKEAKQCAVRANVWPLCASQIWEVIAGTTKTESKPIPVELGRRGNPKKFVRPCIVHII